MKFGQTLKFNAVPEWLDYYVNYESCKNMLTSIRILKTRLFYADSVDDNLSVAEIQREASDPAHDSSDDEAADIDDNHRHPHRTHSHSHDNDNELPPGSDPVAPVPSSEKSLLDPRLPNLSSRSADSAAAFTLSPPSSKRLRDSQTSSPPRPSLNRTASQTVLQDLLVTDAAQKRAPRPPPLPPAPDSGLLRPSQSLFTMPGLSSPMAPLVGQIDENLSARELKRRLDLADSAFFDKLASEEKKVERFFSKMMRLLPVHSHAHEQALAAVFNLPTSDLESGIPSPLGGGVNADAGGPFADANDRTPLIGGAASGEAASGGAVDSPFLDSRPVPLVQFVEPDVTTRQAASLSAAPTITARQKLENDRESQIATLRARMSNHYLDIVGMINFSKLNWNAFDKILKKHDKIIGSETRQLYMANLRARRTFPDASPVERLRDATEILFANAFWKGDLDAAKEELLEGVRDQIIWSRNTVWRDMLRIERKVAAFKTKRSGKIVHNFMGFSCLAKPYPLFLALAMFIIVLWFPAIINALPVPGGKVYPQDTLDAAHRCLALLIVVVILWAQDGLPLYVTSFVVLPATVLLRLLLDDEGKPLHSHAAADRVFHGMSSSTLMLIVCVYTLHAALSKFQIDKKLASEVLSRIRGPEWLLLAVMILSVAMSMLVSNVASPVLLNSIVLPVLRDVPKSGKPFVQCILLGIAVASNIGGMPSPISSPQNAVALGLLKGKYEISFLEWLAVTLPLCALMITLCFLLLVIWFKPHHYRLPKVPVHKERFGIPHYAVIATVLMTVVLWSVHEATDAFGSAGMVAVLPVIIFYGSGLLVKEDFNNLPWDVVYLVAGGTVLGQAVGSSRLLDLVAGRLHHMLGSAPLWVAFTVFISFMAVVSNMVSHTVSAIIVLPIIMEVGVNMGHPRLLVMGGVLACSGAMALPVSSFPNMAALGVMSDMGSPFLNASELLRVGIPMTAICGGVVLICGYSWMRSFGY